MQYLKIKYYCCCLPILLSFISCFNNAALAQQKFHVQYNVSPHDSAFGSLNITREFEDSIAARKYLQGLPGVLQQKGFPAAAVDSVITKDTASLVISVYLGPKITFTAVDVDSLDAQMLEAIGFRKRAKGSQMDFTRIKAFREKVLGYYENSGYPFAELDMKTILTPESNLTASFILKKGPLYKIDSTRNLGKAKVSENFIRHYLGIDNGSTYDNSKLNNVSRKLSELPYLEEAQPWNLTMLGSGATLNLYLQQRKSSAIDVLVGYLPANTTTGKAQLTGDVHLDLKNALGSGENIVINWQQLQPKSPRLVLGYIQPYIFNSNFGLDFAFNLLKKDSNFLSLNARFGIQYILSSNQTATIFYQQERSYLLNGGFDTNQVRVTRKLPTNIDLNTGNFGLNYNLTQTNYRLNPRRGNIFDFTISAGLRKITPNNDIVNLKDPSDPGFNFSSLYDTIKLKSYRLKIQSAFAHFFPMGKSSTLKLASHLALLQSPQYFRNELFQVGGFRLLRGFDEESIYVNRYAIFTAEYRYLVGLNSYFYGFSDAGITKTGGKENSVNNQFFSGGVGISFETKAGLLNLSYAVGKRNDVKFDLRNASKIHFGYINYF